MATSNASTIIVINSESDRHPESANSDDNQQNPKVSSQQDRLFAIQQALKYILEIFAA